MSEHTGFFYWTPSVDKKHPGYGSILGDEDDPATSQPFIMAVMVPPTEVDAEIDLTVEHEATPVTYTQQKIPGLPAYLAKTVAAKASTTRVVAETPGPSNQSVTPSSAEELATTFLGEIIEIVDVPRNPFGSIKPDDTSLGQKIRFKRDGVKPPTIFGNHLHGKKVRFRLKAPQNILACDVEPIVA